MSEKLFAEYKTSSAPETIAAARDFAKNLKKGDAILYTGEMGAGKTHFTKGIAEYLEVSEPVTSPTFALVNEYEGKIPLFHFDLFRINTFDDLYAIGFFDYLDRGGILAIEWSENIPSLADNLEAVYYVDITKTGDDERIITIKEK